MYSGISQLKMARELFISESTYSRKENGLLKIEYNEAVKIAKVLGLDEKLILRYWMADKLYELMKVDKELVKDAIRIVETHYDDYDTCVIIPDKNNSFSSLEERKIRRNKKNK